MEKKEERRFTEEELEQCRKVLEDRGYTASLDLDDSDYGEPDSIVIVKEEDILRQSQKFMKNLMNDRFQGSMNDAISFMQY